MQRTAGELDKMEQIRENVLTNKTKNSLIPRMPHSNSYTTLSFSSCHFGPLWFPSLSFWSSLVSLISQILVYLLLYFLLLFCSVSLLSPEEEESSKALVCNCFPVLRLTGTCVCQKPPFSKRLGCVQLEARVRAHDMPGKETR